MKHAVITVPAYFDERARLATRKAAQIADLDVLRLISEPTAAALTYGLTRDVKGLWGVYDLGGGTFDFSLLQIENGLFNVIVTCGHTALGGDTIDDALLTTLYQSKTHFTTKNAWLTKIQEAKENLSISEKVIFNQDSQSFELTRDMLEKVSSNLINQTLDLVQQTLRESKKTTQDLTGVLLVGGATRTFGLAEKLCAFFDLIFSEETHSAVLQDRKLVRHLNPDHVVALGAGIQAAALDPDSIDSRRHLC